MPDIEEGKQVVTVGRSEPIAAGQATMANSLPVAIASDQSPGPILDNLSAPSEVHDDLLGNPRVQSSLQLWDSTNILAIDPKAWKLTADDTGTPDYSTVTHLPLRVVLSCWLIPMQPTQRGSDAEPLGVPLSDRPHH